MRVVPDDVVGKIEFAEEHVQPWTTNSAAIGSTPAAITAWAAKAAAARAKYQAQQAAQNAAKAATNDLRIAIESLDRATSDVIKQIRTQAALTGDGVYSLAEIPAPALPGPVAKPGTPTGLKVTLKPSGAIEMTWKCANPAGCSGVIYHVYRKIEATGEYHYLGGAGMRKFVDSTVPAGVPSVMYQIQGVRSTGVGDEAEFVVNFGVSAGGATVAAVGPKPAKIAA